MCIFINIIVFRQLPNYIIDTRLLVLVNLMKIGWFDAWRNEQTPSSFEVGSDPFFLDLKLTGLLLIFALPSVAFLLISLGIRRFKLLSIFTFLFAMLSGATLLGNYFRNIRFQPIIFSINTSS